MVVLLRTLDILIQLRFQIGLYIGCNFVAFLIVALLNSFLLSLDDDSKDFISADAVEQDAPLPPEQHVCSTHVGPGQPDDRLNTLEPVSRSQVDMLPATQGDITPKVTPRKKVSLIPSVSQTPTPKVNEHFSGLYLSQASSRSCAIHNDIRRLVSNRTLQDSIWATPKKTSADDNDKTPVQRRNSPRHIKKDTKAPRICDEGKGNIGGEDLCSNKAKPTLKELTLKEKIRAFELKNMGIYPWLDGMFRGPNTGVRSSHLRRQRSYPGLRHTVLAWWAQVEQEQSTGVIPPNDPETYLLNGQYDLTSDYSACEEIRPWDSWSATVLKRRSVLDRANTQADGPRNTRRIFTNFDPAAVAPRIKTVNQTPA
ncbi:hypothetical protein AMATHDRAFT_422 [Amanita thiersii Skay4041]|uniref:Uncharacterized protein n=1 Tax=Amanita thiersii Skay4041 TaxID=703135 RepID=A0A2A9NZM8_9AGAR|nr:hypothetical protein AMATHDRAFT_422 [Amanita thiersii Skay4041]